jgi:exodeoxyribonuclease VII small subunit
MNWRTLVYNTDMPKKLDFTKTYAELEALVADFESRELDLEKDIPRFERGLELAKQLKDRLQEIENKIITINDHTHD